VKKLIQLGLLLMAPLALSAAPIQTGENMTKASHEAAVAQQLIDQHFELWNDTNPAHWPALYGQLYTEQFFVADYAGVARGYEQVTQLMQKVQTAHPGYKFRPAPITWNYGMGRVTWGYGPDDNPDQIHGEDIFTIENGKLASARVFFDKR
jgi:hypothetical protein